MRVEELVMGNMEEMGMIEDDLQHSYGCDSDFLTYTEYQLAEELLPTAFGENLRGEKLIVATPDVNLERVALYWYFRMNDGEIFDGDDADSYVAMDEDGLPDLIIITSPWRERLGIWQRAMIPFLMSVCRDTNLYSNRIVVDSWDNVAMYAFEKECYFIFDDYEDALSCDGCEEAADSFFTILDDGQMNSWIMCSRSNSRCGVFPALSGPSEFY
jgi:hypothetical protein